MSYQCSYFFDKSSLSVLIKCVLIKKGVQDNCTGVFPFIRNRNELLWFGGSLITHKISPVCTCVCMRNFRGTAF